MSKRKLSDYFTREKANEGLRLPLRTPEGVDEGDWVHIQGIDSDAFREARVEQSRRLMAIAQIGEEAKTPEERERCAAIRKDAARDNDLRVTASLITAWSFEEPPTEEAKMTLLREAPYIQQQIDGVAFNRSSFFGRKSSSLSSSLKPPSDSSESQQAPDSPSEPT